MRLPTPHWVEPLRSRLVAGNAVVLLCNGAEYFPALERALDAAQRTVFWRPTCSRPTRAAGGSPGRWLRPRGVALPCI